MMAPNSEEITQETVVRKIDEAVRANSQEMMTQLVQWAGPFYVFGLIFQFARTAICNVAEGKDGESYFKPAQMMAKAFAREFDKREIIDLIKRYKSYNGDVCREIAQSDQLLYACDNFIGSNHGLIIEAQAQLNQIMPVYERHLDYPALAMALRMKGQIYALQGKVKEGVDCLNQSLKISIRLGDKEKEAVAIQAMADILVASDKKEKRLDLYEKALDIYTQIGSMALEHQCSILQKISQLNFEIGYLDDALKSCEKNLELVLSRSDHAAEAQILARMADIYRENNQFSEAADHYKKALAVGLQLGNMSAASECALLANIADLCHRQGQSSEALEYYDKTVSVCQKDGNIPDQGRYIGNMGDIHADLGNWSEALDYYNEALRIFKQRSDKKNEAIALINIGHCYAGMDNKKKAINLYGKALIKARRINDKAVEKFALGKIKFAVLEFDAIKEKKASAALIDATKEIGPGVLYKIILDTLNEGIKSRSRGKTENPAFDQAQLLAWLYAELYKNSEPIQLVDHYNAYDISKCKRKFYGDELLDAGFKYYHNRQWDKAMENWNKAKEIYDSISDTVAIIKVLLNQGVIHCCREQYKTGHSNFEQALKLSRKNGDLSCEAGALVNMGGICAKLGETSAALEYFTQALDIHGQLGEMIPLVETHLNIAEVYLGLQQYRQALEHYRQVVDISQQVEQVHLDDETLLKMGSVYAQVGLYSDALEIYENALRTADQKESCNLINSIGVIYTKIGRFDKALEHYEKALNLSLEVKDGVAAATILQNLGVYYNDMGQPDKALGYYEKSLELAGNFDLKRVMADTYTNMGIIHKNAGDDSKALDFYQKALKTDQQIGDLAREAKDHGNIGYLRICIGNYREGIDEIQNSLHLARQIGDIDTEFKARNMLGDAFRAMGQFVDAAENYRHAIHLIETMYASVQDLNEETRLSLLDAKDSVYMKYFALLLEMHHRYPKNGYDREVFSLSEKSKSRLFLQIMAKARAKSHFIHTAPFQNMMAEESRLSAAITYFKGRLAKEKSFSEPDSEIVASLAEQLTKAEIEIARHTKKVDKQYPGYADLKNPKPVNISEIQGFLNQDEMLISYFSGPVACAVSVIGKASFKLVQIEVGRQEIARKVNQFRNGLDNISSYGDLKQFKPEVGYELYRILFKPIVGELGDTTRLYIAADDFLYTLPFEALIDKPVNSKDYKAAQKKGDLGEGPFLGEYRMLSYLVEKYAFAYLPAASVLPLLRQADTDGSGQWKKQLIGFGDPVFEADQAPAPEMTSPSPMRDGTLARLPESGEEVMAVLEILEGDKEDIYLREKATEENVYRAPLASARYLLFSTHGLLAGDFRGIEEPALALTQVGNSPGFDGFLTMSKVMGLELSAEMVILSACNTCGSGEKAARGEGFAGLTRSFMFAGTQSLLVTHWRVESQSAKELMVTTFKAMKKGFSAANALKTAKQKMMDATFSPGDFFSDCPISRAHPYFWAPFVLVGKAFQA